LANAGRWVSFEDNPSALISDVGLATLGVGQFRASTVLLRDLFAIVGQAIAAATSYESDQRSDNEIAHGSSIRRLPRK
jgi:hypothetical protein